MVTIGKPRSLQQILATLVGSAPSPLAARLQTTPGCSLQPLCGVGMFVSYLSMCGNVMCAKT